MFKNFMLTAIAVSSLSLAVPAIAEENILHIYSSRHYSTDERLYMDFTEKTGIEIKRVDGKGDALIARLEQEGDLSPADLFITVDATRLWRAEQSGLFQPIISKILTESIPENLRSKDGEWFGFSTRARVVVYNTDKIKKGEIRSYTDLTKPEYKGRVCVRSSGNVYNQSLLASIVALNGEEEATRFAKKLLKNLARKPQGGDTDQIKAVAAGICDIALVNSYYFFRLQRSNQADKKAIIENLALSFPDQDKFGTHINISGAGVLKNAKNKDAAIKFLEYLTSDSAQAYFADGNNEYPVVPGVKVNDDVESYRDFKQQQINVRAFGQYAKKAKMIFDKVAFP